MSSGTIDLSLCPDVNRDLGLILLDQDYQVVGMSGWAMEILGMEPGRLGQRVFDYHPSGSRPKISEFLRLARKSPPEAPVAMIIDVLGKVVTIGLAPLHMAPHWETSFLVATIMDATEDMGAVVEPTSGQVRLSKFPVYQNGSFCFVDSASIFYFQADGNYCRIHTGVTSHYVLMTLKNVLRRYTGPQFFRVHKSYVANLDKIGELKLKGGGQAEIVFDSPGVEPVPVARRRLPELRKILGL